MPDLRLRTLLERFLTGSEVVDQAGSGLKVLETWLRRCVDPSTRPGTSRGRRLHDGKSSRQASIGARRAVDQVSSSEPPLLAAGPAAPPRPLIAFHPHRLLSVQLRERKQRGGAP